MVTRAEQLFTAACMWEAVLEEPETTTTGQAILSFRENWGTCELRTVVLSLADDLERDWPAYHERHPDNSFDWDFVPAWLHDRLPNLLNNHLRG